MHIDAKLKNISKSNSVSYLKNHITANSIYFRFYTTLIFLVHHSNRLNKHTKTILKDTEGNISNTLTLFLITARIKS